MVPRLLMVLALAGSLVVLPSASAAACTCEERGDPPYEELARAAAGVVGVLTGPEAAHDGSGDGLARIVVEASLKIDLGREVLVMIDGSSSCQTSARVGNRIGILTADLEAWELHLCSEYAPDALLQAAHPPDTAPGPIAFLTGGAFGEAPTAGLNVAGEIAAYGAGQGETVAIAVCPGQRRAVEIVDDRTHRGEPHRPMRVRDLETFDISHELDHDRLVGNAVALQNGLRELSCRDVEGSEILARLAWEDSKPSRIVHMRGTKVSTIVENFFRNVHFRESDALALAGEDYSTLATIDLSSGVLTPLLALPEDVRSFVAADDGASLFALAGPAVADQHPDVGQRLLRITLRDAPAITAEVAIPGSEGRYLRVAPATGGGVIVIDDGRWLRYGPDLTEPDVWRHDSPLHLLGEQDGALIAIDDGWLHRFAAWGAPAVASGSLPLDGMQIGPLEVLDPPVALAAPPRRAEGVPVFRPPPPPMSLDQSDLAPASPTAWPLERSLLVAGLLALAVAGVAAARWRR